MPDEINYKDYLDLKYELTLSLGLLTENVNKLAEIFNLRFEGQDKVIAEQNKKISCLEDSHRITSTAGNDKTKVLLYIILGIAFLGTLGAAIGINLLKYFPAQ